MLSTLVPYVGIAAAGACVWAMPWVQGPTPDGRSLDLGAPSGVSSTATPSESRPSPSASATPSNSAKPERSRLDRSVSQRPAEPERLAPTEPLELRLADRGISSEVVSVGLDNSMGVVVPDNVSVTGWYDRSRPLGASQGATVIVGHRDAYDQGPGALYDIESLDIGSRVTVLGTDGRESSFEVQQIELILKTDLPARAPEVFTRQGPYHLKLITCGGDFDAGARSYLSNVVVTAVPVADS
jgi:hypothetical protein